MMAPQKKKPLPGQHHKVEPLTRKMEAAAPPRPQLEVLQERMNQTATAVQVDKLHGEAMGRIDATRAEMHKLHGETMGRMDAMQERMDHMATREEMHKLHGETMGRIDILQERMGHMATREEMHELHGEAMGRIEILQERTKSMATTADMNKLHGEAMERIGKVETCIGEIKGDLKFIKWIGGTLGIAIVAGLITMIAGLAKIIFFPVV